MKKYKFVISILIVFLAFSCNANLSPEADDSSPQEGLARELKKFTYEDIDDTWWVVFKDDHDGFVVDYPIEMPWCWFSISKPGHWVEPGTVEDYDPDKDGARETATLHGYYHFKDKEFISYNKIIINDDGDIKGEHVDHVYRKGEPAISGELYEHHNYGEFEIVDGVIKVKSITIIDGIFYSEDEEDVIYEDYGNRQTYMRKVNLEDIQ